MSSDDGAALLTSEGVGGLLSAAVTHAGGTLVAWALDHVDANPNQSTTATYSAIVDWPFGRRDELLGVSARANGLSASDSRAEMPSARANSGRIRWATAATKLPSAPGNPAAASTSGAALSRAMRSGDS